MHYIATKQRNEGERVPSRDTPMAEPLDFATLAEIYPPLAKLAAKVSAAIPPRGWRFWAHRRRLREALAEIIDRDDWDSYAAALARLLRLWEADAPRTPQQPNAPPHDTNVHLNQSPLE